MLYIIISIISKNRKFVNKFSTSREDIPFLGLWVLRISVCYCVDLIL